MFIRTVVLHIYNESKAFFKGTEFAKDWYFYHDALSLMTKADCRKWMKKEGILKHWILPPKGLNDEFKHYKHTPVGACHEVMPLDSHLNQDAHFSVTRHVVATGHIKDIHDDRKFDISTPKTGSKAYLRVWNPDHGPDAGCPTQDRIREDIERICVGKSCILLEIWAAHGIALEEHGAGHGRRRRKGMPRGGHRPKISYCKKAGGWLHSLAAGEVEKRCAKNAAKKLFELD